MSKPTNEVEMNVLTAGAVKWGIDLSAGQVSQFRQYLGLLLDWNERINLTAVRDAEQIQLRHFLDALSCIFATGDLNGRSLVDVGTGAGLPGLPLKIVYPDLQLTLVESVTKKAGFLQAVVDELALTHVQVINARAEQVGHDPDHRQTYDWAVARAVARFAVLVEYLLPLVQTGGKILAQKGRRAPEEMIEAERGIALLGGGQPHLFPVQLPGQNESSYLVTLEKVEPTPEKYPRRIGVPAKRPL